MSSNRGRCAGLRLAGKIGSGSGEQVDDMRPVDEEYLFGSISPRGGGTAHLLGDLESPDHTQRDTTESDNNISSCSTLDIVNKVSICSAIYLIANSMCGGGQFNRGLVGGSVVVCSLLAAVTCAQLRTNAFKCHFVGAIGYNKGRRQYDV